MKILKLGVIGLSEGNGHPYSWSAIFNGYDKKYMKDCPFPVIPEYLAKQQFPRDTIKNAYVTHIWTQDKKMSQHCARSSKIENVVDTYTDIIGRVDAVLLARDDPENHYTMSKPFLKAGLPVFIDKPLALSVAQANKIYRLQKYPGQIFTCSAISYGKEYKLPKQTLKKLGKLLVVNAAIMKSWEKYGIHIIEPVMTMLPTWCKRIKKITTTKSGEVRTVSVVWNSGLITNFSNLGYVQNVPIIVDVIGDHGHERIFFQDTFYAFKSALQEFVDIVRGKKEKQKKEKVLKIISIVEKGLN